MKKDYTREKGYFDINRAYALFKDNKIKKSAIELILKEYDLTPTSMLCKVKGAVCRAEEKGKPEHAKIIEVIYIAPDYMKKPSTEPNYFGF